jgi:hypothetical protein
MIELIRSILVLAALALMGGGYLASQYATLFGDPVAYHAAIDAPAVSRLSLLLLVGAIAVGQVRTAGRSEA